MTDNFSIYLDEITDAVIAAIPDATFKAAEHVHQVAMTRTPVETGNLVGESSVEPTAGGGAHVLYPGPYARYQEYGVSRNGKALRHKVGQSFFLSSSILGETEAALEIMATTLRKAIP